MTNTREEFSSKVKERANERAGGKCELCGMPFGKKRKHFDHRLPCALGGKAELANCQVICEPCHKAKTAKEDIPRIRKADRQRRADNGIKREPPRPLQSRNTLAIGKTPKVPKTPVVGMTRLQRWAAQGETE